MKKSRQITRTMIEDHNEIERLLNIFKENQDKEFEVIYELYGNFADKLDRHFSLEEQAIFVFAGISDEQDKKIIADLITEHENIKKYVARVKNLITMNQKVDISDICDILMSHRKKEDQVLYPRLDESLNESEKKYITERITMSLSEI